MRTWKCDKCNNINNDTFEHCYKCNIRISFKEEGKLWLKELGDNPINTFFSFLIVIIFIIAVIYFLIMMFS